MAKVARAWNFNIDFLGHMRPVLAVSGALCIASLALVMTRGLNFGTDFAGGYEIQVHLPQAASETEIRERLGPLGLADARVQRFGPEADHAFLILVRGDFGTLSGARRQALDAGLGALGHAQAPRLTVAEGGEALGLDFHEAIAEARVRALLRDAGLEVKGVEMSGRGEAPHVRVELVGLGDRVGRALDTGGGPAGIIERIDFVGPQVGGQLRAQGLTAVVYALFFILLYVAVRFDMLFSPGAIIATLHDVVITVGFLSLFRVEFSLNVVAAILTLIGFSLNDTIVVYDRIRENVARRPSAPLAELVNRAINDTLSRTVLTSGTVLLVTAALLVLGGPFIFGLAITMFVGVVVGTYSSIAVASPLYILLRRRFGGPARGRPLRSAAAGGKGAPDGGPALRLSTGALRGRATPPA